MDQYKIYADDGLTTSVHLERALGHWGSLGKMDGQRMYSREACTSHAPLSRRVSWKVLKRRGDNWRRTELPREDGSSCLSIMRHSLLDATLIIHTAVGDQEKVRLWEGRKRCYDEAAREEAEEENR
jgi:hypothetical protein